MDRMDIDGPSSRRRESQPRAIPIGASESAARARALFTDSCQYCLGTQSPFITNPQGRAGFAVGQAFSALKRTSPFAATTADSQAPPESRSVAQPVHAVDMSPLTSPPTGMSMPLAMDIPGGTSFEPAAPLPIPNSGTTPPTPGTMAPSQPPPSPTLQAGLSAYATIPDSISGLSPSYPAALFGGLSADDEHVTVWDPVTGKTVAGNAAPYRRNLGTWLKSHPGWAEKADELKSSKRRAAARRSRLAATSFSALCAFPVARSLAADAASRLDELGCEQPTDEAVAEWSADDFVRLQESLFRVGQEAHIAQQSGDEEDPDRWATVIAHVGGSKEEAVVLYVARHMLTVGVQKSQRELSTGGTGDLESPSLGASGAMGIPGNSSSHDLASPGSFGSLDQSSFRGANSQSALSLPNIPLGGATSLFERSFRTPKEPRITVWHPDTGKTISGNAAPCRRNLETWMAQHPGWRPKSEDQLSSSRRVKTKKSRPSSTPSINPSPSSFSAESPIVQDAVQGLLGLAESPSRNFSGLEMKNGLLAKSLDRGSTLLLSTPSATGVKGVAKSSKRVHLKALKGSDHSARKSAALTSSVSSTSSGEETAASSEVHDAEDVEMQVL